MAALSVLWAGIKVSEPADNGEIPVATRIIEEARSNRIPKGGLTGLMSSLIKRKVSPIIALKKVLTLVSGKTKEPTDELLTALSNQIRNIAGTHEDLSLEAVESISLDIWTKIMDDEDRQKMTDSSDLIILRGVSTELHQKVLELIKKGNERVHFLTIASCLTPSSNGNS